MTEIASATWPESERDDRILLVPVGSIEQHGPHLPLATDTMVAVAVATEVATRREDIAVAPAVPYGASGEHEGFPGTMSVGREALASYLLELVRSAAATYPRIAFVNGHGGNAETLTDIVERARGEGRDARCWAPQIAGGDLHAGRVETSLLLALAPQTVRRSRMVVGDTRPLAQIWPQLRREGVRAVSANGVLGDPTSASAEEGRALYARLVDDLELFLDRWPR